MDSDNRHESCIAKSRQRYSDINISFSIPVDFSSEELILWTELIVNDIRSYDKELARSDFTSDGLDYLELSLNLVCSLLTAAKIPLFSAIKILRFFRDSINVSSEYISFRSILRTPLVDGVSARELKSLLEISFRMIQWMYEHRFQSPHDESRRDAFFDFVSAQLNMFLNANSARGKSTFYVLEACFKAAIPVCHVAGTVYQLGWGKQSQRIDRSLTDQDSLLGARLTHNKLLTAELLHKAGMPAPYHACVSDVQSAQAAAQMIGWPIVIKPADAERGEGVSVDVTPENLDAAFSAALENSPGRRVLVERQITGTCHRLFVTQGRLLYAVKRLPIGLYGDGVRSIAELTQALALQEMSLPPWRREHIPELDALAMVELSRQGYISQDIPLAGAFVSFRRIETTAWGGVDEDMTEHVHPENVRIAESTAQVTGLAVAGIDIISPDITRPWYENNAIINEVNYAPLLGEGTISRRYVPEYLKRLLGGDGRIPVAVFVGDGKASAAAVAQARTWRDLGLHTVVTSHDWTEIETQRPLPMPSCKLHDRVMALVLSRDVEALIIIVSNDGLVDTGLPLEGVDSVAYHGTVVRNKSSKEASSRHSKLMAMLSDWPWTRCI